MLGERQNWKVPKEELKHLLQCRLISDTQALEFIDRGQADLNFPSNKTQAEPEDLSVRLRSPAMHDAPQVEATSTETSGAPGEEMMGGRKMIGIRYLFPQFPDQMSLLQRTRIWVARHDYGYFVGWTEQDLQKVEPLLRPLRPVSLCDYKKHMNRSEFCRNVKLKYCLEADTAWARDFRDRLSRAHQQGGFKGLCDVKQAAAELWRKYSERYRGNQARYPNPKSKYKYRQPDRTRDEGDMYGTPKRPRLSMEGDDGSVGPRSANSSPGTWSASRGLPSPSDESRRPLSADAAPTYRMFEPQHMDIMHPATGPSHDDKDLTNPSQSHKDEPPVSYNKLLNGAIERLCRQSTGGDHKVGVEEPEVWRTRSVGEGEWAPSVLEEPRFFPPPPAALPLAERLDVWLERHRRSYFVNVSPADLEHVPAVLRPTHSLTSANLEQCVPRAFREAVERLIAVKASADPCAVRFKELLLLSPEEGGFSSVVDALQEGSSVHKMIQCDQAQSIERMNGRYGSDRNIETSSWTGDDINHKYLNGKKATWTSEKEQRCQHTPGVTKGCTPRPDDLSDHQESPRATKCVHSLHENRPHFSHSLTVEMIGREQNDIDKEYTHYSPRVTGSSVGNKISNSHDNGYLHVKHHKTSGDPRSASPSYSTHRHSYPLISEKLVAPTTGAPQREPPAGADKMDMVRSLWSYRLHLQALLRDDPRLSWRQKLEPFLPVLRNISGDYELPDRSSDCAVDLVLAVLHGAIMDH